MNAIEACFKEKFGHYPDAIASAPGRVNLLGEHTDYNDGLVLPMALPLRVSVALSRSDDKGKLAIHSDQFNDRAIVNLNAQPSGHWSDYILGAFQYSDRVAPDDSGYELFVSSTLPIGAGISSSAALEVATLEGIDRLLSDHRDPIQLAQIAQRVERDFVGMPCGIMDQFAAALGSQGQALFIDTQDLAYQLLPLFPGYCFIVTHSGVTHKHTDSGYTQRVHECQSACQQLNISSLRELSIDDMQHIDKLPEPLNHRARHVVTENQRVTDAVTLLQSGSAKQFGELMTSSHISQRDDYAVSIDLIDNMVDAANAVGALGARLTGGGFGGSIVALVAAERADDWCAQITQQFPQARILANSATPPP